MDESERKRRERLLFLVFLLLGIGILFCVGQCAIRLAPTWGVTANMRSNLNPNNDFLTLNSGEIVEPLNPDILTVPPWFDIFLTPNATMPTSVIITPPATLVPTLIPTQPSTLVPTLPATLPPTVIIYTVPVTPPTNNPPLPQSDLAITKTDGVLTYSVGDTITYTLEVTNGGPNNASGFRITDTVPAVITVTLVNCTPAGVASCGTNASIGNNILFTDASVNTGAGNQLTITIRGTVNAGAAGFLNNTAEIVIPGGANFRDNNTGNNTASETDTPGIDLAISKDDGQANYVPGGTRTYNIIVTNSSTFTVNGAVVTDSFPAQISSASWLCVGSGGATCNNGSGNVLNDTVNLPPGQNATYTVTANFYPSALGSVENTASVTAPAGFIDTNPGNESDTDTDTCTTNEPDVGPRDGTWINVGGTPLVIVLSPAITPDGDVNTPDLVYYEREFVPGQVQMDRVQVEISTDGVTWITVFYWGNGVPDTNSNLDISDPSFGGTEADNRTILTGDMYNLTGVTIDIDSIPGIVFGNTYSWVRITSRGVDGAEVDAIQPYYP